MKQLKRSFLKLLMLFVGLFALNQTAGAWFLRGYLPNSSGDLEDMWSGPGYDMGSFNSYTLPQLKSTGVCYFKIYSTQYGDQTPIFGAYSSSNDGQGNADLSPHDSGNKYGSTGAGNNWGYNCAQFYLNLDKDYEYTIYVSDHNSSGNQTANIYYSRVYKPQTTIPTTYTPSRNVWVRGDMNNFECRSEWKFNYDSSSDQYTLSNVSISSSQKFKIAGDSWSTSLEDGAVNFGNGTQIDPSGTQNVTWNSDDIYLTEDFYGDIIFKITEYTSTSQKATLTFTKKSSGSGDAKPGIVGEGWSDAFWSLNSADYGRFVQADNDWWYADLVSNGKALKFRIRYWYNNSNRQYQPDRGGDMQAVNGTVYETWGRIPQGENLPGGENYEDPNGTFQISNPQNLKTYRVWFNTVTRLVMVTWDETDGKMPFFPNGITRETQMSTIDANKEFYYLVGHGLNAGQPSPEWQMDGPFGTGNDEYYTLKFTYNIHSCSNSGKNVIGVKYFKTNMSTSKYAINPFSYRPSVNSGWEAAGVRMLATYYPNRGGKTDGSRGELVLQVLDNNDNPITDDEQIAKKAQYLPFVSFVGQNWKQREDKEIPTALGNIPAERFSEEYSDWQTTDKGWQQSWIQYDANGNPIKSRDGNSVYYSTQWPPKNEIVFTTTFTTGTGSSAKTNEISLTSSELTFVPEGDAQAASVWKADPRFTDAKFSDGSQYRMYKVSDMWLVGAFKLWSGWNGLCNYVYGDNNSKDGRAEWDNNWNWGSVNAPAFGNQDKLNYGTRQVNMRTDNGDMIFDEPTYFKNVYFFLDLDHPHSNTAQHCFLYFEAARGSIFARSKPNGYRYGEFITELMNGSSSEKVTNIKLDVHPLKDVNNEYGVNLWNHKVTKSISTADSDEFNAYFKENFSEAGDNYWADEYGYEKGGYYYYTLTVTTLNGTTVDSFVVKSNPFFIDAGNVNTDLNAYQLVKKSDSNSYITYKEGAEKVYEVAGSVDEVTSVTEFKGDAQRIYEIDGQWTNMVFVSCEVIDDIKSEDFGFTNPRITAYTVGSTSLGTKSMTKLNDKYYCAIFDKTDKLTTSRLTSTITVTHDGPDNEQLKNLNYSTATYTPSFMLPSFVKNSAKIYFDDNQEPRDFTASHDDLNAPNDGTDVTQQTKVNTYRNELMAQLKLNMPNVSSANGLKTAVYNALNVGIKAYTSSDNAENQAVYVSKADENATEYVINYRYQSPYDWMYEDVKNPGNWYGVQRIWNLDGSNYEGVVNGIVPTHEDRPFSISYQAEPQFTEPQYENGSAKYHADINPVGGEWVAKLYLRELKLGVPDQDDALFPEGTNNCFVHDFTDKSNLAFLIKVDEIGGPVPVKPVNRVVSHNELTQIYDEKSNGVPNESDPKVDEYDSLIAEFTIPISDNLEADNQKLSALLDKLHVRMAYAYYFAACPRTDSQPEDGTLESQSSMKGFKAGYQVPVIRYDHASDNVESVRALRAVLTDDNTPEMPDYTNTASGKLIQGDDSFLLAPVYADVKAADESFREAGGQLTGVDSIAVDGIGNVLVGRGFIDLNGNEGMIYSTDGRALYQGNGRKNLESGVYVVTFAGRSLKVLVK